MPYKDPDKQREYGRTWIRERRRAFFEDKECVNCGSRDRLELDHIDPSQKAEHSIWSWSKVRREAEIAKCQILCRPCHWEKTKAQMGWGKHGTPSCYKRGCRLPGCRTAYSAYRKELRNRKRKAEQ
ncbi:HNH endonuclease [Streptomyces atriruber]|uniref:HNH endonuclease n=1 Tax=Streptomyces atriruber TaxID=545121 RepID=UPI00099E7CF6|nr:hypothetical protein [Streptomyces atriruber]